MQNKRVLQKILSFTRPLCAFLLAFLLIGCDVELYQNLDEKQANAILAALLENNIAAQKEAQGKDGFAILVDEDNVVRALDLLNNKNLPAQTFQNLGSIFNNEGLVASSSSEQARMAYAISQELSETFTQIDGVLTARVHVVLGKQDQSNKFVVEPSAAIFIRHLPTSPVVNYLVQLKNLTSKSVPKIHEDNISVVLMPVRESVSVPWVDAPTFLQTFIQESKESPLLMTMLGLISLACLVYLGRLAWSVISSYTTKKTEPPQEDEV